MSYCGSALVKYFAQTAYSQIGMGSEGELNSFIAGTLIPQASKIIDSYTGSSFGTPTLGTWKFDGNGKAVLFLPIDKVPFLGVGGGSINSSAITVSQVKVHPQVLELDGSVWTKGKLNITIYGSHGYVSVPPDIQYVTAQLCANVLNDMVRRKVYPDVFMQMASSGGDANALMASSAVFTKGLKDLCEPYRIMWVDIG